MNQVWMTGEGSGSYAAARVMREQYGRYFGNWPWQWYITLVFSSDVGQHQADVILNSWINEVEKRNRAPLSLLIGKERANFSGCGRPCGRIHFHALVRCPQPLDPEHLADLWRQPQFGGNRTSGSGAHIVPYDPAQAAAGYLLKGWDWRGHRLELASPVRAESCRISSRMRKQRRRHCPGWDPEGLGVCSQICTAAEPDRPAGDN